MNASNEGTGGRLQALLLLAPLALAWPGPGSVLVGDVFPQATAVGFTALALLPAAVVLLVRGFGSEADRALPSVRGLWLLLVPVLVAIAWLSTDRLTDTFEASRVLLQWIVALACVLIGASLTQPGRSTLVRGAVLVSLLLAGFAGLDTDHAFTGALGNTGSVSEAALAGAVAGAALCAVGRGPWRIAGALATLVFLLYTTRVPVLAGSLSCAVGIGALVVVRTGRARGLATLMLALALGAMLVPFIPRTSTAPAHASVAPSPAGGVAVRAQIWQSSVPMSAAHPLAGIGPGQFAATFPAWRDAREIERTTHGRRLAEETEVEHPHNDWLAPALEGGWLAGLAWVAFLVLVGWRAWRVLHEPDPADIALAAAALALLVNAFVRGPLLQNPVSSVLAFSIFGALLARHPDATRRFARRIVVVGSVALLVVVAPRAMAFVRHGFALQRLSAPDADGAAVQRAVAEAIDACPDSVPARSWSARIAQARGAGPPLVIAEWERVLDQRPLRIEAWLQIGNQRSVSDADGARAAYARVLDLDPHHPGALQNMGTLELNAGRPAQGLAWFDRMPAHRAPARPWLEELAARLALRGLDDSAEAVFARAAPELAGRTPEQCFALSKDAQRDDRPAWIADAWELRAHLKWAREHAAAGRFSDAVRSYRQAARLSELHAREPRRIRLELAAALYLAGKVDEARAQAASLEATAEDLAALPEWAGAPLRAGFAEDKR